MGINGQVLSQIGNKRNIPHVASIYIPKPSIDAATLVQNLTPLLNEDPRTCESPELSLTINNHQASLQWNIPLSIYIAITYDAD